MTSGSAWQTLRSWAPALVVFVAWLFVSLIALRFANAVWNGVVGIGVILLFSLMALYVWLGTATFKPFASAFLLTGLGYLLLNFAWARCPKLSGHEDSPVLHALAGILRSWNPDVDAYLPDFTSGYGCGPTPFNKIKLQPLSNPLDVEASNNESPANRSYVLARTPELIFPECAAPTELAVSARVTARLPVTAALPTNTFLAQVSKPPQRNDKRYQELLIRLHYYPPIGHRMFAIFCGLLGGLYAQRLARCRQNSKV